MTAGPDPLRAADEQFSSGDGNTDGIRRLLRRRAGDSTRIDTRLNTYPPFGPSAVRNRRRNSLRRIEPVRGLRDKRSGTIRRPPDPARPSSVFEIVLLQSDLIDRRPPVG
jgi:hypothetical protein